MWEDHFEFKKDMVYRMQVLPSCHIRLFVFLPFLAREKEYNVVTKISPDSGGEKCMKCATFELV